ncbi:MAG: DUF1579 family protein [Thermoleophilaceae bacterium]|nr:DUF1579 family protein [Thermoleophilaceae bacterium]
MGLEAFIGEWSIEVALPGAPEGDIGARMTFEWLPGERFLAQRWQIPVPEAPDGLAVIGYDEGRGTFLQHYFDSRGVARVYEMTLDDGVWTLAREQPDFSPFEFAQRYEGRFSADGDTIEGRWDIRHEGRDWEKDFDITYRRLR